MFQIQRLFRIITKNHLAYPNSKCLNNNSRKTTLRYKIDTFPRKTYLSVFPSALIGYPQTIIFLKGI